MNKIHKFFIAFALASILAPVAVHAQTANSTSLTITPPFFELNVNPGDSWSSSIRVVNTNAAPLQVNAQVMGFQAADDLGHGSFIQLSQLAGNSDALANWITVTSAGVTIPSDGAADVPFSVSVPPNASPGGHYAAILIGTGAPTAQAGESQVGVSSFISALIFVRVSGNVVESAQIHAFSTDKSLYQTPDVHFAINIQNTGNAHIRPVGMVQIYNAFGKLRGQISINGTGTLGYVLPSSTREFDVEWQGQPSLLDIGPYTAVLSLAYGENTTKSITQTIGFWILPIGQLFEVGLSIIIAALVCIYILKRIIRSMLANEIKKYGDGAEESAPERPASPAPEAKKEKAETPPGDDILDLRNKKRK